MEFFEASQVVPLQPLLPGRSYFLQRNSFYGDGESPPHSAFRDSVPPHHLQYKGLGEDDPSQIEELTPVVLTARSLGELLRMHGSLSDREALVANATSADMVSVTHPSFATQPTATQGALPHMGASIAPSERGSNARSDEETCGVKLATYGTYALDKSRIMYGLNGSPAGPMPERRSLDGGHRTARKWSEHEWASQSLWHTGPILRTAATVASGSGTPSVSLTPPAAELLPSEAPPVTCRGDATGCLCSGENCAWYSTPSPEGEVGPLRSNCFSALERWPCQVTPLVTDPAAKTAGASFPGCLPARLEAKETVGARIHTFLEQRCQSGSIGLPFSTPCRESIEGLGHAGGVPAGLARSSIAERPPCFPNLDAAEGDRRSHEGLVPAGRGAREIHRTQSWGLPLAPDSASLESGGGAQQGSRKESVTAGALSLKAELAMYDDLEEGDVMSRSAERGSKEALLLSCKEGCPGLATRAGGGAEIGGNGSICGGGGGRPGRSTAGSSRGLPDTLETMGDGAVSGTGGCALFEPAVLVQATAGWAPRCIIGKGRCGTVYRGWLYGCQVAVKRLEASVKQRESGYANELQVLGAARHPNILLLLGHCPESRSLVYEYMPGGSIQDHLETARSGASGCGGGGLPPLSWAERVRVLADVSAALAFLHRSSPPVVHRDLKPQNILLDSARRAKLGDAGLARLLGDEDAGVTANVSGTFGYIDPDQIVSLLVTPMNDVYALGIIVLQLLMGEPEVSRVHQLLRECAEGGPRHARQQRIVAAVLASLDTVAGAWPGEVARELALLGLCCSNRQPEQRPDLVDDVIPALSAMLASPAAEAALQAKDLGLEEQLVCPLSKRRMTDPVLAADGFTYERASIEAWFQAHDWSPMTGSCVPHKGLLTNNSLRNLLSAPTNGASDFILTAKLSASDSWQP